MTTREKDPNLDDVSISFKRCITLLILNNLIEFNNKLTNNITDDELAKIALACIEIDKEEYFMNVIKTIREPKNIWVILKYIVDRNHIKYLEILTKGENMSKGGESKSGNIMDCRHDGINILEYTIHCIKCAEYKHDFFRMIILLNDVICDRNPTWWDFLMGTNIYDKKDASEFDRCVFDNIALQIKPTCNIQEKVYILNYSVISALIKYKRHDELIKYIEINNKFIEISMLLHILQHYIGNQCQQNKRRCDGCVSISIKTLEKIIAMCYVKESMDAIIIFCLKMKMYSFLHKMKWISLNEDIFNILIYIFKNNDVEGLIFILEYEDKRIIDYKKVGDNLLHIFCQQMNMPEVCCEMRDMLKVLLHYKPNMIFEMNDKKETALFMVVENDELMEFFLTKGIDIKQKNDVGDTFIHNIIRFKKGDMESTIKKMLRYTDASILNTQNNDGDTCLILAGKNKKETICNMMIEHADVNCDLTDIHGNSIRHYIGLYGLTKVNIVIKKEEINKYGNSITDYTIQNIMNMIKTE